MTKKGWLVFSFLCVMLLAGLVWFSQKSKVDVSTVPLAKVQPATAASGNISDHTLGNTKSKVIMIEYGDFQCPGCGAAHPVMKKIAEKYSAQIAFVFRNYPLYSAHANAYTAATAAEAAGLQGKYWEMHNYLFENQGSWSQLSGDARANYFNNTAELLGLDVKRFTSDQISNDVKKKIDFDTALGKKADISGTPSIYINDKNVGDQYILNGKIVPKNTTDAKLIWSDQALFESLVLNPILKEHGIEPPAS
ncbi:MAG: thioredoxin domain-containing protein [Candidatus Saccharimonas sp.]